MKTNKFIEGEKAYFISNGVYINAVTVIRVTNSFVTIRFNDTGAGTRVRESKLYKTKEEAEVVLKKIKKSQDTYFNKDEYFNI